MYNIVYWVSLSQAFTRPLQRRPVPDPAPPIHGDLSPSKFVYVYGEVATYTCDAGYRRDGDARTVCQLDDTWTGTTPSCIGKQHIDGLVQKRRNSIANALKSRLSWTNSSICDGAHPLVFITGATICIFSRCIPPDGSFNQYCWWI